MSNNDYEIISYGDEIFNMPIKFPYEKYEREYREHQIKEKLKERKKKLEEIFKSTQNEGR